MVTYFLIFYLNGYLIKKLSSIKIYMTLDNGKNVHEYNTMIYKYKTTNQTYLKNIR